MPRFGTLRSGFALVLNPAPQELEKPVFGNRTPMLVGHVAASSTGLAIPAYFREETPGVGIKQISFTVVIHFAMRQIMVLVQILAIPDMIHELCPRRESNPHLRFRKPPFYPLNYGDV